MKLIDYPGHLNQQCQAEYGIALQDDSWVTRSDIVVIVSLPSREDPRTQTKCARRGIKWAKILSLILARRRLLDTASP